VNGKKLESNYCQISSTQSACVCCRTLVLPVGLPFQWSLIFSKKKYLWAWKIKLFLVEEKRATKIKVFLRLIRKECRIKTFASEHFIKFDVLFHLCSFFLQMPHEKLHRMEKSFYVAELKQY
jgi:hypothetical protein